jgi:hypothetical protein
MKRFLSHLFGITLIFFATTAIATPQVSDVEWKDAARERVLPLKLRAPQGAEKVPLVIFSHGLGGSRDGGKAWGEHWSQHGYFVIHVQHPGSDKSLLTSGASVIEQLKRGVTADQLLGRVDDVRFVLDEIARRQSAGEVSLARIDLKRIAMTTMALADARHPGPIKSLADDRFQAFIALSPQVQGLKRSWPDRYGQMKKPFLSITGTIDGDMIGNGANPKKRAALFDAQPAGDKYRVVFENGDHSVFGGGTIRESEVFSKLIDDRKKRTDPATATLIQEKTKTLTLKYLDAYLKNDTNAKQWLVNEAAKVLGDATTWAMK